MFDPDSCLESIGEECFANSGLKQIVIPGKVKTIGRDTFSNCAMLQEVTFEADSCLVSIGEECFANSGIR